MATKEKADYFVKINNPKSVRRILLENTRDVIKILQGYEEFKNVRKTRIELVDTFKKEMNEVKALVSQLKKTLPKMSVRGAKKAPVTRTAVSVKKQDKELRKLEDELSDIES